MVVIRLTINDIQAIHRGSSNIKSPCTDTATLAGNISALIAMFELSPIVDGVQVDVYNGPMQRSILTYESANKWTYFRKIIRVANHTPRRSALKQVAPGNGTGRHTHPVYIARST